LPARAAIVLVLAVAVLGGCAGEDDERARVREFLRKTNAVIRLSADEFKHANQAYAAYARGRLPAGEAAVTFRSAERDIRAARGRVATLRPPGDARALHSRLVRVFDMNLGFAHQTRLLASYQDRAGESLTRLGRAERNLRTGLGDAEGPDAQVAAMERFADGLQRTRRDLRALEVPRLLLVPHADQLRRLGVTYELAHELRGALEAQDEKRVAKLLVRFRDQANVPRPRQGPSPQAIVGYRQRYRELNHAYADLAREQARLERELD
jgi:hypothetical protein